MSSILIDYFFENGEIDRTTFDKYLQRLKAIRDKLPETVYQFAVAGWHYDNQDHQCPHDSWIESIEINEVASGSRSEIRKIEIKIKCLGAFHDGYFYLHHRGVTKYSINHHAKQPNTHGHGDWLLDEISLSKDDLVVHEIIFNENSKITIECTDIEYNWSSLA